METTMENILHLSPLQAFLVVAIQIWLFVIFPVIVIRKINYITELLEAQFDEDQADDQ